MRIELEDNRGGDYIIIETIDGDNSNVILEVGHQCVVVLRHRMPVASMTSALAQWWDGGKNLPWSEEYNQEILNRITPISAHH